MERVMPALHIKKKKKKKKKKRRKESIAHTSYPNLYVT